MRSRWVVTLAVCVALGTGCSPVDGCGTGTDDEPERIEDGDRYLPRAVRPAKRPSG